jgi:putative hydrolases of HD superfamily
MHEQIAQALLTLYSQVAALKLLPRAGWLQRGVSGAESVAEHTFGVAVLALLIGERVAIPASDLRNLGAERGEGEGASAVEIERGKLLAIALLHDLAEALLNDLPASGRRLIGAEAKRAAERRAIEELFAGLPDRAEYLALWEEYAAGTSAEARLVKELDRVEMLAQALAYERAGSRALSEFWVGADRGWSDEFPLVRALAAKLIEQRKT